MNNKIKKTLLTGMVSTIVISAQPVLANGLGVGPIDVSGRIQTQSTFNDGEMSTQIAHAEARMSVALSETIKAIIALELASAMNNTVDSSDLKRIIEEAYLEIDGDRATVRFGKMTSELSQFVSQMAIPENDQLFDVNRIEGVMAIQVDLSDEMLQMAGDVLDSLQVTVFENGENDFEISDNAGINVAATRQLTNKILAEVTARYIQHNSGDEAGASFGLAYLMDDGSQVMAKVQWLDGNPTYVDADYAIEIGYSTEFGPGTVVLSASYVDENGGQLGASYQLPLNSHMVLAPEVRYDTESEDFSVGVSLTIQGQQRIKELNGQ